MSPDQIKEKIKSIIQLPALPSVVMEVADLADNPKTNAAMLAKIISTDQALTAKVLKIANSPFYGFPKKISTIEFAIIIIGFDALKEIIMSVAIVNSMDQDSDDYFDIKLFWDHSITCGVIARRMAQKLGYRVTGEAFVGGLLHDMGISALHRYFKKEFKEIVNSMRESGVSYIEAERSILQVTHAEVGSWLAERWNLPEHLVQAVALHHRPGEAKSKPELISIIHCADVIASRIAPIQLEFESGLNFDESALKHLRISDQGFIDECVTNYTAMIPELIANAQAPEGSQMPGQQG